MQRVYRPSGSPLGPARDATWAVRGGEVVVVTDGYHPFVATDADDAYYLNALAGDRRTMACSFDPALDHVRSRWPDEATDPRVPLVPPAVLTPGPRDEASSEAAGPVAQVGLESRLRQPDALASLGEGQAIARGRERPERIAQAMLAELGELDRGHDRGPPGTRGEARPGVGRLVPAPEPAQEVGALDGDPVGRPGRGERSRPGRRRRCRESDRRCPPKSAGTRGDHQGTSPPDTGDAHGSSRVDARSEWHRRRRRVLGLDGKRAVVAVEGLAQPPGPGEGPGQAGQVPGRRRPARLRACRSPSASSTSRRASERTSWSLWRTTVDERLRPDPPRRKPR